MWRSAAAFRGASAAGPKLLVACGGVALASRPAAQRIGPAGLAAKWMRGAGGGGDMEWMKQRTDGGRVDGAESRRRRQPGDGVDGEQSSDLRVPGGGEPAIGGQREREAAEGGSGLRRLGDGTDTGPWATGGVGRA